MLEQRILKGQYFDGMRQIKCEWQIDLPREQEPDAPGILTSAVVDYLMEHQDSKFLGTDASVIGTKLMEYRSYILWRGKCIVMKCIAASEKELSDKSVRVNTMLLNDIEKFISLIAQQPIVKLKGID